MTALTSESDGGTRGFAYRVYPLSPAGTIEGPAIALEAETDHEAVREASERLGDLRFEVWNGKRRIVLPWRSQ